MSVKIQKAENEAVASFRFVRVTPLKARRVVNMVRGKSTSDAISILKFSNQKVARVVLKLLMSAISNARNAAERRGKFDENTLLINQIFVDEGMTMKRFRPRAKGRADRLMKKTCHITISLIEPEGVS